MPAGARPCVGLVSLQDYLDELARFAVVTYEVQDVMTAHRRGE